MRRGENRCGYYSGRDFDPELSPAFGEAQAYGAAALGDIGRHFPDTDPRFKDISSLVLLKHVVQLLRANNYEIINIDATVILQQPRISPYIKRMRDNIAQALGVQIDQVSVKATTNEELGFLGTGDGAAAYAVASIRGKQLGLDL